MRRSSSPSFASRSSQAGTMTILRMRIRGLSLEAVGAAIERAAHGGGAPGASAHQLRAPRAPGARQSLRSPRAGRGAARLGRQEELVAEGRDAGSSATSRSRVGAAVAVAVEVAVAVAVEVAVEVKTGSSRARWSPT